MLRELEGGWLIEGRVINIYRAYEGSIFDKYLWRSNACALRDINITSAGEVKCWRMIRASRTKFVPGDHSPRDICSQKAPGLQKPCNFFDSSTAAQKPRASSSTNSISVQPLPRILLPKTNECLSYNFFVEISDWIFYYQYLFISQSSRSCHIHLVSIFRNIQVYWITNKLSVEYFSK